MTPIKTNRVIIAGGRDFESYDLLKSECERLLQNLDFEDTVFLNGGQVSQDKTGRKFGADYLATVYAKERGTEVLYFHADWDKFKKAAGPIRNEEMASCGTHLIAFWDGFSRGTKNMIDTARKYGLTVRIIKYEPIPKVHKPVKKGFGTIKPEHRRPLKTS